MTDITPIALAARFCLPYLMLALFISTAWTFHASILLTTLVTPLFGTFKAIVAAAAFTILIYYSIANLAAVRMRKEDKLFPNWIPVAGLISCILLAFTMPLNVVGAGLALLAVGFIWRALYRRLINSNEK